LTSSELSNKFAGIFIKMLHWLTYIVLVWLIIQPVSCTENAMKVCNTSVEAETEESFDELVQYNHFPID